MISDTRLPKLKKGSLNSGNVSKILLIILFLFDQIRPKNRLLYYKLKVNGVNGQLATCQP